MLDIPDLERMELAETSMNAVWGFTTAM